MHWNINGQVDRYGSRAEALYFLPGMMLFMSAVFGLVGMVSGARLKTNATKGLNIVAIATVVFMLVIHNSLLSPNRGAIPGMLPILLPALLMVMGFAIKGVEPNPFIGIRVSWTMNSPMVWRITHERASRLWIIGGAVGVILGLVGAPIWLPIAIFVGCIFYPMIDSFRISKAV